VTQTSEPSASSTIINAIFHSAQDVTLMEILTDANNGAQVIGKILAISTIPADEKAKMVEAVRQVLPTIKAYSTPPYRLLLEAVGLPVPATALRASPMTAPNQRQSLSAPWQQHQGHMQQGQQHHQYQHHHQQQHQHQHQQQQQQQQLGTPPHQYGFYPYNQPMQTSPMNSMIGQMSGMNLSPLLVPQNMPMGQMRGQQQQPGGYPGGTAGAGGGGGMNQTTPNPNLTPRPDQSPRTPVAHPRGRMDMMHQMMSPASDPFNPVSDDLYSIP
jgi:protein JSN1